MMPHLKPDASEYIAEPICTKCNEPIRHEPYASFGGNLVPYIPAKLYHISCIPVLKPEPQDADTWPEDNSIVFATIEDCKKAQQLFEDWQAQQKGRAVNQITQAVLEEAEWWAAQAGHTGPAHPDMLDKDCAMCCRIVKLRGGHD